jgi:hypothetical protein
MLIHFYGSASIFVLSSIIAVKPGFSSRKGPYTIYHISLQERQLATLADACLQRDARVVELEAKLIALEPYRNFVEQVRS